MGIGFLLLVYNVYYSFRYSEREKTGDAWDGRTLEWSTTTAIPPHYNFAQIPTVKGLDAFWLMKQEKQPAKEVEYKPIHMPSYSGRPFIMSAFLFVSGFGLVFSWWPVAIVGGIGTLICMILRSFDEDDGYYVSVEKIKRTESA